MARLSQALAILLTPVFMYVTTTGVAASSRPEFGKKTFVTGLGKEFEYTDATLTGDGSSSIGTEPIEEINQWLLDQKFKCLNLSKVKLSNASGRGTTAVARMQTIGDKRFVIVCNGDCRGVRYSITGRLKRGPTANRVWHFATSQPYPTFHIRSPLFLKSSIAFEFRTQEPGATAEIKVFQWSAQFGDYGEGCKIF